MNILCCGFFPALQRMIEFETLIPGEVNRARSVTESVGGKATNAARVLQTLGAKPLVLSFAGGSTGLEIKTLLQQEQLPFRFVETDAETRTCQTLLSDDSNGCTELVEDTRPLTQNDWTTFVNTFGEIEQDFDRIIMCGSLPPHAPTDIYAQLLAATDPNKVLVDTSGEALLATLALNPSIVKINASEIRSTLKTEGEIAPLAKQLIKQGAQVVGITQGADDTLLFTSDKNLAFSVPKVDVVNPIGCGDSVNAGITFSLGRGEPLEEAFKLGLACAASNAMSIEPGKVKSSQIATLQSKIIASHNGERFTT